MVVSESELNALLDRFDNEVRDLTHQSRELVLDVLPPTVESCEGGDLGFGIGPGYKGLVFVVTPMRDAVKVGVVGGASLPDPHKLMQGSGKLHRHVRLELGTDAARPELRELLEAALRAKSRPA
jgi:hypothetical protein